VRASSFALHVTLQVIQIHLPKCAIAFDPPDDALQWSRLQFVHALASDPLFAHEPGLAQHAQVLGDRGPTVIEVVGQAVHRRWTGAQAIEDRAPGRVGDRAKDIGVSECTCHEWVTNQICVDSLAIGKSRRFQLRVTEWLLN
jgi:hypothetical protein